MSPNQPQPSFTFTIPSIYDDIDLDCRIHNPPNSILFPPAHQSPWRPRGAVVAHPYAPLGGCYDDWIVLGVVEECLKKGLVVGTFNFRGAPGSKSTSSWTGKSELDDYISFAGLLIHYLQTLTNSSSLLQSLSNTPSDSGNTHLSPIPSNALPSHQHIPGTSPISQPVAQGIDLLLAGYSYGSLITTCLPPTPQLLQRFSQPKAGSAQAEILARAHSLATQTLKDAQLLQEYRRGRAQMAMGGEEGEPGSRRISRDGSRKSIDLAVRKSIDHTRRSIDRGRRRLLRKGSGGSGLESSEDAEAARHTTPESVPLPSLGLDLDIQTSYVLVSPLLPPVASLAIMHLSSMFKLHANHADTQKKLVENPTFVVYGEGDFFTSSKKLRKWCAALNGPGHGNFESHEVKGAGHFWREEGVEEELRRLVASWIDRAIIVEKSGPGQVDSQMGK